ncbi:MAG: extracellular solute-binding protein [Proteobacteria bacterium]|nr:extracellular solute-binding protein [Pseudomonadota bacterium]
MVGSKVGSDVGRMRLAGWLFAALISPALQADEPVDLFGPVDELEYEHAYAFLAEPAYDADFPHFDFVNPDAPKGGRIRVPQMGNWDNFNPVTEKGRLAGGLGFWSRDENLLFDSLMVPALDEPATLYGRLAEGIAVAPDNSWVAFKIREGARWHDGVPITADDVIFSFGFYSTDAEPGIVTSFKPYSIEKLGPREFLFRIPEAFRKDPSVPIRLAGLIVLPKHYWQERDLTRTTVEPPLGSGPYRVGKFRIGQWVEFERVPDYWGRDLPVNVGRYNFDVVKYDYFQDDQVQTEAVKGNLVDIHVENVPRTWFDSYDIPALEDGMLIKEELQLARPAGLWWPVFWNMQQPRFQDIRVRKALWLLNDMEWGNRRSYGFWGLATSFFHDSELAATGLPDERELKLLEPLRGQIPETVFTQPYEPQPNRGRGWSRENLLAAAQLLEQAGWVVQDNTLVHTVTGEPFEIRFVAVSPALGGSFVPFTRLLKRLGINTSIKSPEISNWLNRMRSGDFDAGAIWFLPDNLPTLLIKNSFASEEAGKAYGSNWSNLMDPAIDALIAAITGAETWDDYVAAIRAFDRVMLHNYYWIPMMSKTRHAIAYWNNYGKPDHGRLLRLAFTDLWWWDQEKAESVRRYRDTN